MPRCFLAAVASGAGLVLALTSCTTGPTRASARTSSASEKRAADCCNYFEPFATVGISDCESSTCKVMWCDGAETTSNQCGDESGRALKVLATSDGNSGPVVWVWWGDQKVKEVRIEFKYGQHQGTAPQPHLASSHLDYKRSTADTFDKKSCPSAGFTRLADMPKTHTTTFDCFDVSESVPVEKGQRALYFRFSKRSSGRNTPLLRIDDLRITVVPEPSPPPPAR